MVLLKGSVLACGASVVALIAAVGSAQAQAVVAENSPQASVPGAPAAAPTSNSGAEANLSQVSEVVVTATRRNERLHDVPEQVSAVGGDVLQTLRARTLADFAALTPGLSFQTTNPGSSLIAIRGVTTGGTQLNSAVGLYLDDVPLGSSTPFGGGVLALNVDTFDLNRVEVLNGPQGTLFGANTLGGTLRYITSAPRPGQFGGRLEAEGGYTEHGDGDSAVRGEVNAPVGEKLALRLEGLLQHTSGWIDDPSHGRNNQGDARTLQGRASLLFQATDDISVRLTGYADRIRSNGTDDAFLNPVTHAPVQGDYDQSFQSAQPSELSVYLVDNTIDWNLHWAKLTSITAYQELHTKSIVDFAVPYSAILSAVLGPAGVNPYTVPTDDLTKRVTQEVRLASPDNHVFEYVTGVFYSHEDTTQSIGVNNTADPQGRLFGIPLGHFDLPSTVEEVAIFANGTIYLPYHFDFTAGIRESWNDQVFASSGVGLVVNPAAPFTPVSNIGKSSESDTTYLFNLRFRPTRATTVYGRIASGYRPGGPNLVTGGSNTGNATFGSDDLWNYELGVKQTLAGGRAEIDASAYHIDWSKIQQVRNVGGVNQLVNAGDAEIDGVDTSGKLRLLSGFSLLASASYTDARLTTVAPVLGISYEGARLPVSPRFSAALAANYDFRVGPFAANANLSFRHVGDRTAGYAGSAVAPLYRLGAYDMLDLLTSFRSPSGWEVAPYIRNIFDERGEVSASTVRNQYVPTTPVPVSLTQPRTFGVVFGRSF